MSLTTSEMTPADIAAVTGNNSRDSYGFGGDGAWWIIILFLFVFCGWGGNGGWGGNNGANSPGFQGLATRADINEGFALNGIENGIRSIQTGICDSTYALTNALNIGFSSAELSRCNQQAALMQQLNNMAMQSQDCCCQTQRAIDSVNYNMATQACDTRNTIQNSTRDIIDNANANSRAILDFLTQDKISSLQAENQTLKFQASQNAQNAFITANQEAQTAELIRRISPSPVPAYQVPNPYTGCCGYSACNC